MKWGAVLYKKWFADDNTATHIYGYWAEDDTQYEMVVPSQLRKQIIEIQNWLCDRYQRLQSARTKVCDLENFFTYQDGIAPSGKDDSPMPHENFLDDC